MQKLKFSQEEMDNAFQLVAAILHLGNMQFEPAMGKEGPDPARSVISNRQDITLRHQSHKA